MWTGEIRLRVDEVAGSQYWYVFAFRRIRSNPPHPSETLLPLSVKTIP